MKKPAATVAPRGQAMKVQKTVMKAKRVMKPKLVTKHTLSQALVASLKQQSGRKDITFDAAADVADKAMQSVPIEKRAGFPLILRPGTVHPKDWVTAGGVKVMVDFTRIKCLPDDWGQGVKMTERNGRSQKGGGGTLQCFVSPDGKKVFYHRFAAEAWRGKPFTEEEGFNGQVRLARLQAEQAVQLARAQIKESRSGGESQLIGFDKDESLFKVLSPKERAHLAPKEQLHFCIVSARRATKIEGVRDIWMVQTQFLEAGVTPTWYVDEDSLKDYKALGLRAVVGGKLTEARNKALKDAYKLGKACVQVSDDISAWEYRDGKQAADRSDEASNAAWAAAKRLVISPVAAARFILAKMRGADAPQPKLGGVYMLGSCSRTFGTDPFSRQHFILGDFFVADWSPVRFDTEMRLKEDYDFTCAHIKAHGSVMRCNRMTLKVKHYANDGGACSNRDKKGEEERRNIEILKRKWPGWFRAHHKRKNEVILQWRANPKAGDDACEEGDEAAEDEGEEEARKSSAKPPRALARQASNEDGRSTPKASANPPRVLARPACSEDGRSAPKERVLARQASKEGVLTRSAARERHLTRQPSRERTLTRQPSKERTLTRQPSKERTLTRQASKEDAMADKAPANPPRVLARQASNEDGKPAPKERVLTRQPSRERMLTRSAARARLLARQASKEDAMADKASSSSKKQETPLAQRRSARLSRVQKATLKGPPSASTKFPLDAIIVRTEKPDHNNLYIADRMKKVAGHKVGSVVGTLRVKTAKGDVTTYMRKDLSYDIARGYLTLQLRGSTHE